MDPVISLMYEHSLDIEKHLTPEISEELKKRVADSFITAFGASKSTPVKMERSGLLPSMGKMNSSIYFTREIAESSVAAFINGSMTRYLDFNDTYLSKEALHPSDNVPPLMAVAESMEKTGKEFLNALAVSYSVICGLSDAFSIRNRGWDHVTYISISAAAGLGKLAELDADRFENCISLGINNNISMRQTRAGELSMWKGLTAANASRNSVFALSLSSHGITGPSSVFNGEMGFFKQVSDNFTLVLDPSRILHTMIKNYPVEYHAMSAVESCARIRDEVQGEIEDIEVETFSVADNIIIKDPEKKRPKTKETADHSMPYLIAYTLLYGEPDAGSYDEKYLNDKKILSLIDREKFTVTDDFNAKYPEHLPFRIRVTTNTGKIDDEVLDPRGHFRNPFTWDDLVDKGRKVMGEDACREVISSVRKLESKSIKEIVEVLSSVNN